MATKKKRRPVAKKKAKSGRATRKVATRKVATRKVATRKVAKRGARRVAAKKPVLSEKARLTRNKKLVIAMYQKLIGEKDFDAARRYLGDTYRQHSPYATDGHEGVANFVKGFKEAFPNHRYEVKKVIAEGAFVVLHLHGINGLNPNGESVVDIFRIENGKVVEHWDVIQAIPDKADNPNTMF